MPDYSVNRHSNDDEEDLLSSTRSGDSPEPSTSSRNRNEPNDKYNIIYFIFYLLGMTTLLPWNFFITAEDYWMYKFRNTTSPNATDLTPTQAGFMSDLNVASAIPNTIFLILNTFLSHKIPLKWRMMGSMTTVFLLFTMTTAFVKINTDSFQSLFLGITLLTVVTMNVASAILSGGLFGVAGQFPSEYMTAVVSGQSLGGIFAAITEILSLTFGASPQVTAFVYFLIGTIVMVLSIVAYFTMSRTVFFRYYTIDKMAAEERLLTDLDEEDSEGVTTLVEVREPNFQTVFKKVWIYGFVEWIIFVVTVALYPAVTVLISSEHKGNHHLWNDVYFVTVVNYLIFNSGDYLGRILAGLLQYPKDNPKLLAFGSVLRIAFIPLFMLCNAQPRENLPVLIHSDVIYIVIMVVFALSNGYMTNMGLISAPNCVEPHEKEMASSMMAAFLGVGLAFGSAFSVIFVKML